MGPVEGYMKVGRNTFAQKIFRLIFGRVIIFKFDTSAAGDSRFTMSTGKVHGGFYSDFRYAL